MATPAFAELHCLSNFSFLRGASHPEELVERAAELGYAALALTDECSLAGVVRAHQAARSAGIHLVIGSELRLDDGPGLVLLAADREGYGNLAQRITRGRRRADKGSYRLERADLEDGVPGCLALWLPDRGSDDATLEAEGHWLATTFPGRAWLAVECLGDGDDAGWLDRTAELAGRLALPRVATNDVHMHRRSRRPLQDLVTAIRHNCPVAEAGHRLFANGERHLRSRERLARIHPPALLAESRAIAGRCRFSLDELRYQYPLDCLPDDRSPAEHLRRLTEAGMREHWPEGAPERVRRLVEHELAIIAELEYEPYFLVVHDIVRFARSRGILCQGRGSAANSAVCFCLGITAVDPSRMEMLFERFVSRERNEPPDIDVDFEHHRREEVLQYVYATYGRHRAALAATVICYRPKSALRDTARVLGLDADRAERLAGAVIWGSRRQVPDAAIREAGFDPGNPLIHRLLVLVNQLIGSPRHLSQHVGGMVIARDRLDRLVPVENAAMEDRTVIQWDKDDLDAMGLLKVDCLALGMLTAIHRCFDLVRRHRGRSLDLAGIPAEDPAVYAMISRAETMGVFQIESRAQMAMLPRLRPATFYDLVIEVALVRPGPIQGDMVHPYLKRRQGIEPVRYPSEAVRAVLARTLGVPLFQEQVIQLAMVAAGFSAGEADELRRAIGAWRRRDQLARFQRRVVEGMRARGYPERFAEQVYRQIHGFGEYGFPESHAASFALLVYVSAWLKHHEPAAFACALLNSQPMGFYAPAQLVREARRQGVTVRPVDVRESAWDCTLEAGDGEQPALRLGLRMVRGLSRDGGQRLAAVRETRGFANFTEMQHRARLARRDLEALAESGALERLAGHRHAARWEVLGAEGTLPLFGDAALPEAKPDLPAPSEGQALVADYASLGLTLGRHPLALLRDRLGRLRCRPAAIVQSQKDRSFVRTAGLVITRQRPGSASGTVFLTLEDETGHLNCIVREQTALRHRREVLGGRLLRVTGHLQREGEVMHVIAARLEDLTPLLGELDTRSRDFC